MTHAGASSTTDESKLTPKESIILHWHDACLVSRLEATGEAPGISPCGVTLVVEVVSMTTLCISVMRTGADAVQLPRIDACARSDKGIA